MSILIQNDILSFFGEMSENTDVWVVIGVNAYLDGTDPNPTNILIDPSSLSDDDESKLRAREEWSDWGRFIKILNPRLVPFTTHSP